MANYFRCLLLRDLVISREKKTWYYKNICGQKSVFLQFDQVNGVISGTYEKQNCSLHQDKLKMYKYGILCFGVITSYSKNSA